MRIFIILFTILVKISTLQITNRDLTTNPTNRNQNINFRITFILQTQLSTTDLLKIVFPINITGISDTSILELQTECDLHPRILLATIQRPNDLTLYATFTDANSNPYALIPNVIYNFTFKANLTSSTTETSGLKGPVEIYTVSDTTTNAVVYDSHPSFGYFQISASVGTLSTLTLTASASNATFAGFVHPVDIVFNPLFLIASSARVMGRFTNPNYTFEYCYPVNETGFSNFPFRYTSSVENNKFKIFINQTMPGSSIITYKIRCGIRNPYTTGQSTSFELITAFGGMERYVEIGTITTSLSVTSSTNAYTTPISWNPIYHSVMLGWGVSASDATSLDVLAVYKDANSAEKWYQTVKISFSPTQTLPTQNYTTIFYTVSDSAFLVIKNSLQTTLPSYDSLYPVKCDFTSQIGMITCTGVGVLRAGTVYYLAFKYNLGSSATATTNNFGMIDIYTQTSPPYLIVQTGAKTMKNTTIFTNVALSSTVQNVAYTKTTSNSVSYDYINAGATNNLFFEFNYFTNTIIDNSARSPYNKGIEFYTSFSLPSVTSPTCGFSGLTSSDISITNCEVTSGSSHTVLRFRIAQLISLTNVATVFGSSISVGEAYFNNVAFVSSKLSDLSYIGENIYDFYARWIAYSSSSTTATTSTLGNPFFFNSLVYQSGALSNLIITQAFMTSANQGTYFPTLIRVTGNFSSSDITSASVLMIFFNDLTPLNPDSPCFGNAAVRCTLMSGSIDNTMTDDLPDYTSSRVLLMKFTNGFSTSSFNIYVPVYNNASVSSLGFFAVLGIDTGNSYFTQNNIYRTTFSKRFLTSSFASAPSVSPTLAPTTDAFLNFSSWYSQGSLINTSIVSSHILSTGSNYGSHYSICAPYDFYSSGLTSSLSSSSVPASINSCANLAYQFTEARMFCRVCPIHQEFSGNISLINFKLPVLSGIDAGNYTIQTSLDNGFLNFSVIDVKSDNLNLSTIQYFELHAPGLMITTANQRITARMIFGVDVPKSSYLVFQSNTSITLTQSSTLTSCYVNIAGKTCSYSSSDTYSYTLLLSSTDDSIYKAGVYYEFSFFVDLTSVTTASNISYNASVLVPGTYGLVTQQISDITQTLIEQNVSNTTFQLSNLSYTSGNLQSTTMISFSLNLPSIYPFVNNRYATCSLGTIGRINNDGNVSYHCSINQSNTNSLLFKSCDTSNLSQLTFTARNYVPTGSITISITHLKLVAFVVSPVISCSLYETNGNLLATSDNLNFPLITAARQFLASDINLFAQFPLPGVVANLTLMTIFRNNDVAPTDSIYLYFPSYYAPRLGYDSIYCLIGSSKIKCEMHGAYMLRITNFPGTLARLARIFISIFGVRFPRVPTLNDEYFWVAYDNDADPSSVVQSGYIPPIYNIAYPSSLRAGFYVEVPLDNIISNFYFIIDTAFLNPFLVTSGATIFIDMPNIFTSTFSLDATPRTAITITNSESGSALPFALGNFGGRISLTILSDFAATGMYIIKFANFLTPTTVVCNFPMPTIAILSSNNFDLLYLTASNTIDNPYTSFLDSSGSNLVVKSLAWYDANGNQISNITVYDGVYSELISLGTTDGSLLQTTITITEKTSNFISLPGTLSIASGIRFLSFRIATKAGLATSNFYKLTYQISNTLSLIYQNPPILLVYLSSGQAVISPSNFSLPSGGYSLPIVFDFSLFNAIPRDGVTITASILDSVSGLFYLQTPASVSFNSSQFVQSFVYAVFANVTRGNVLRVQYALSGANSASYRLSSSIALATITNVISGLPVISGFSILTSISPVSQSFRITSSQSINLYYFNVRAENYVPIKCPTLLTMATIPATYSFSDATQAQYGIVKLEVPGVSSTFTISNLLSKTDYAVQFCPYNQGANFGSSFVTNYTTLDNMQQIYTLNFIFTQTLTDYQLASICCYFSQQTLLPAKNVLSLDRSISCNEISTTNTVNRNVARFFTIYAFGDKTASTVNSSITNILYWTIGNLSTSSSAYYQSFFSLLSTIGLSSAFSNATVSIASSSVVPVVYFVGSTTVILEKDSFSIKNVNTNVDATIYAVLFRATDSLPTQSQIKVGYDNSGRYYYSSLTLPIYAGISTSITFSGLDPQLRYTVSYFAEAGFLTGYIRQTNVVSVNGTTLAYSLSSNRIQVWNFLMLLCGVLVFVLL